MIYSLIEIVLISTIVYCIFKIGKTIFQNVEPITDELDPNTLKKEYKETYEEELSGDFSNITDKIERTLLLQTANEYIILFSLVALGLTFALGVLCTNYYWGVSCYTKQVLVVSACMVVSAFIAFIMQNGMLMRIVTYVVYVFFIPYAFLLMSYFSACIGNMLYQGQEKILPHRIVSSTISYQKKNVYYYLKVSPVDDLATSLMTINEEQIFVADRYMLTWVKGIFSPLITRLEKPTNDYLIGVPKEFVDKQHADSENLHQFNVSMPLGDTIGVAVRKAYFGEVMAKSDLEECFKMTVNNNGKLSYEPLILE